MRDGRLLAICPTQYPGIRYTNMNLPSQITDPLETGVEEEHHNWNDAHFLEFPTVH